MTTRLKDYYMQFMEALTHERDPYQKEDLYIMKWKMVTIVRLKAAVGLNS